MLAAFGNGVPLLPMLGPSGPTGPTAAQNVSVAAPGGGAADVVRTMCQAMGFAYDAQKNQCAAAKPLVKLQIDPRVIACAKSGGRWDPAAQKCGPKPLLRFVLPPNATVNLLGGRLSSQSFHPLVIPAAVEAPVKTKILMLSPGQSSFPGLVQGVPQIGFEEHEGLWIVGASARPILAAAMATMTYAPDVQGDAGDTVTGIAAFVVGQTSGNAQSSVDQKIGAGYAALVDKASLQTGVLKLVFTKDPSVVVAKAGGDNATHALLSDKPPLVVGAALADLNGGQVPPAALAPASSVPWVPIALVGAAAVVGAALLLKPKSATRATPNPRRKKKRCSCR